MHLAREESKSEAEVASLAERLEGVGLRERRPEAMEGTD